MKPMPAASPGDIGFLLGVSSVLWLAVAELLLVSILVAAESGGVVVKDVNVDVVVVVVVCGHAPSPGLQS